MSDPTRKSALPPDVVQWGAMIRVRIDGCLDSIITLPPRLTNQDQCEEWLGALGLKMVDGVKFQDFTDEEKSVIEAIQHAGAMLILNGLQWRAESFFDPAHIKEIAKAAAEASKQAVQ